MYNNSVNPFGQADNNNMPQVPQMQLDQSDAPAPRAMNDMNNMNNMNMNNMNNGCNGSIFVKTLTGKNIMIDYNENMKISEIKECVCSQENVPVEQQRLIYEGKQLEDNMSLKDYGITSNSTIHLVLRLR